MCLEHWPSEAAKTVFTLTILLSQYILPLVILPCFYCSVRNTVVNYVRALQYFLFVKYSSESEATDRVPSLRDAIRKKKKKVLDICQKGWVGVAIKTKQK